MKSAFLITAHGNFEMLKYLIKALDYKDNGIYIHLDKKCGKVNYAQFETVATASHVECLRDRIDVNWGGISLTDCALRLLLAAQNRGG